MLPLFQAPDVGALEGLTFLLLSNTEDGWPHLAMISVGETVALDDRHLRLALWRNSTASGNLSREGRATLALVYANAGWYIRLACTRGEDLQVSTGERYAYFDATVEEVIEDAAPYADLASGVTFRLKDSSAILPRWQATVDALRSRA